MKKEITIIVGIIFLSALFELLGLFSSFANWGQQYSSTVLSKNVALVTYLSKPYTSFLLTRSKAEYVQRLESEYAKILIQSNEIDALKAENEQLKKLLGATDRKLSQKNIITAPLTSLAFPAVGAGSDHGVEGGDMVLVDGVLVGTIESVGAQQSRVSLLSNKRKQRILVKTESGAEGVIDSDGKNILLTHIPRSHTVNRLEKVVTIGQEGIEKDILVGTITLEQHQPADPTQTFVVSQLVSFYTAVLVEIQ